MTAVFDMTLVQRGARLKRTPFFEATQRYGARAYTVYNHTLFPICFDDLEAEYWKLLEDVTLWDVGVERQVEITGPDRFTFANLLTPRDLSTCRVGQCKYVLITDESGGIINDPVLLRLGENHFWLAVADSDVILWAKGVAVNLGLRVQIREPDVSPLQIQGPKSKDVVEVLFGKKARDLPYYHFLEEDLDDIPVVVTRTGWSGEIGYEVYLRLGNRGTELWDRIMEAGKPFKIAPTGPSDIRRIEAGILNHGADMTIENNPYEVGLGRLVDLGQDADFIGKEALRRLATEGVDRKLVGLEIEGEPLDMNMTSWPAVQGKAQIGYVTSAVWSPRLKKNIGYAWVPADQAAPGTDMTVVIPRHGERRAAIVPKPFVDPRKQIPIS